MNKTAVQLEFLKVEEGITYLVTIPADCTAEELARFIRGELHRDGIVMTECHIDHEFAKED